MRIRQSAILLALIVTALSDSPCVRAQTATKPTVQTPAPGIKTGLNKPKAGTAATAGTPAVVKPPIVPPTDTAVGKTLLFADGDFANLSAAETACDACLYVLGNDNNVLDDQPKLISLTSTEIAVRTKASVSDAKFILAGKSTQLKTYPVVTAAGATNIRKAVLSGAFCVNNSSGLCVDKQHLPTGDVYGAADGPSYRLTVTSITPTRVSVTYVAPSDFRPQTFTLENSSEHTDVLPFVQARAPVTQELVYQSFDLAGLCTHPEKPCKDQFTVAAPDSPDSKLEVLAQQSSLAYLRVTSPGGSEPVVVVATALSANDSKTESSANSVRSAILRRVTKPSADQSLLDINMTVMDQQTARSNYGRRIAEHYIAVTLDVKNRTNKKLQFNKAAITFDADFRAVGGPSHNLGHAGLDFIDDLTANALITPNIYYENFSPYSKSDVNYCAKHSDATIRKRLNGEEYLAHAEVTKDSPCLQVFYRYGIEQTAHLSPINFLSALGAFDATTERTDRALRFVELLGAALIPISSGSIVAQIHNTAFHDAISIFTGTFLPGYRSLELDPAAINRLRTNLVAQTMQETVQVPQGPGGYTSTIVLLPRDGMLAVRGREQTVVIDRLIDVHIDADVVNGTKGAALPADKVEIGYTAEQVRQAIGEPYKIAPDDSTKQSVWTYSNGAFSTVTFDKDGHVIEAVARSTSNQLDQLATLADATDFLRRHNLPWTRLSLQNGNSILVDIPTFDNENVPLFDSKDKRIGVYKLRYAGITTWAASNPAPTVADFSAKLAAAFLGTGAYPAPNGTVGPNAQLTYIMPDILGGTLSITLDKTGKLVQPKPTFSGNKPQTFLTTLPPTTN